MKTNRNKIITILILTIPAFFLALSQQVSAEIDQLDTSFGGVGYVTHNGAAGGVGNDGAYSIQIQSDGKYIVAGFSVNLAGNMDMTLWRYNSDGTLDTTFNSVGFVIHNGAAGGNGADYVESVAIQNDGKYVCTGASNNLAGNADMTIWRFNQDGTLDTTFNGVGYVYHNGAAGGNGSDLGANIAIQSDGKYVVAGWSSRRKWK